jgi:hypothetical protein
VARQNGWKGNKSSKNQKTLAEALALAKQREAAQAALKANAERIERLRSARHLTEMGFVLPHIDG